MRKKNLSCLFAILTILFFISLVLIGFWFGVPLLVEKQFGTCAQGLTDFQCRIYGTHILIHRDSLKTIPGIYEDNIEFQISQGESIANIARSLKENGLITEEDDFINYLIYTGLDSQIKAGKYTFSSSLTPVQIAEEIRSNKDIVSFFIYPGWRAEEIADALPSSGIEVTPSDFLDMVKSPSNLTDKSMILTFPSAEGFLFPGMYEIPRKISADQLVMLFVRRFERAVTDDIISGFQKQGLDLYQGVTLASIIQRESYQEDERTKIASVLYNRLSAGMRLETDPTVQYALGYSDTWEGWWKTPLLISDLDINSPYNTYLVYGLPPTPIANPDLSSLMAAAFPEVTPFYYFRAACDNSGYHQFSKTYEEHTAKACK